VRAWPVVTTDGTGVVSHTGTALLHPRQGLVDLAVMLADATVASWSPF
jgi:hypothetical protein